ncbi:hypothetical protein [Nonomuraea rubra]|uniref:Uncharacterized protein n=1 Tax=Nonomuraea rubra TaxID=46180 RepID=A0A7X0U3K4_9ACTN|nr:hypothetical protein [Nonomuraea rubra]MBB6553560.1 hypothetical protein [Nonomuraea rubra]
MAVVFCGMKAMKATDTSAAAHTPAQATLVRVCPARQAGDHHSGRPGGQRHTSKADMKYPRCDARILGHITAQAELFAMCD